jgi:hypothetical protein
MRRNASTGAPAGNIPIIAGSGVLVLTIVPASAASGLVPYAPETFDIVISAVPERISLFVAVHSEMSADQDQLDAASAPADAPNCEASSAV